MPYENVSGYKIPATHLIIKKMVLFCRRFVDIFVYLIYI